MTVQPGWYRDPAEPTTQRYWDGEGWLGAPLPIDTTPPPGPPTATEQQELPAPDAASAPGGAPVTPIPGPSTMTPGVPGPSPWSLTPPGAAAPGQPPPGAVPPPGWGSAPGQPPPDVVPPPGWPANYYPHGYPPPRPHGMALAPLGHRVVARLIDIGLVLLLNVLVNGWFVWRYAQEIAPVYREAWRRSMAGNSSTEGLPEPGEQAAWLQIVILLIAAGLWFAYEVPAVANTGQTIGKRLMRIRVVSLGGDGRLGFGQSTRRWTPLGLPTTLWFCCGLGLLMQLIDCAFPLFDRPLRQALHDRSAKTVVVALPPGPGDQKPTDPPDPPGDRR